MTTASGSGLAGTSARRVSRVVFVCGPAGSGTSTYARSLEHQGMTRLSLDVELWRRGAAGARPQEATEQIESELQARLLALVTAGADVVLDLSFWSRDVRDSYRALLSSTGVGPETVYLATDRDTVLCRLRRRCGEHADDVVLDEEVTARYVDGFEPPTPDEGSLTVVG